MPIHFKDSVDREVTGDQVPALPSLVQTETTVSAAFLESRGSHADIEFSPKVTFDDVGSLGQNQYGTYVQRAATIDGTIEIQQDVVNNGDQISAVQVEDTPPPPTTTVDPALAAALAGAIQAGLLIIDPITGLIVPAPAPQAESEPPPPPPQATDAGAPEAPASTPNGQVTQEELPPDGCQTVDFIDFDAAGNLLGTHQEHFDGNSFSVI